MNNVDSGTNRQNGGAGASSSSAENHQPPLAEIMLIRAMQQHQKADEAKKVDEAEKHKRQLPNISKISTKVNSGSVDGFSTHEGMVTGSKIIQMVWYCDTNETCYQDKDVYRQRPFYRTTFHTQASPDSYTKHTSPPGAIATVFNQQEIMFQMGRRYVVTMETEEDFFERIELIRKLKAMQVGVLPTDNSAMGMDGNGSADQQQQQPSGE